MTHIPYVLGGLLLLGFLQDPPGRPAQGDGAAVDSNRIRWVRPFKVAMQQAKESRRLVFAKPILGGSNTPKSGGIVAGGKNDCDGSW